MKEYGNEARFSSASDTTLRIIQRRATTVARAIMVNEHISSRDSMMNYLYLLLEWSLFELRYLVLGMECSNQDV